MTKFESEDYETFQKDTQIVTYSTLGITNGNLLPISDLLFGVYKNEKEALFGISEVIADVFSESFEYKLGKDYDSKKGVDAELEFGIRPFNALKFKRFIQSPEWNQYLTTSDSFIFFKILPLIDYLDKSFNKNNVIYVPFS
tara:strand:+ start:2396 stop:2818 length:423 start_codon:yes stop_codon:yes gene_type:complete